jgi:hypothetical protein
MRRADTSRKVTADQRGAFVYDEKCSKRGEDHGKPRSDRHSPGTYWSGVIEGCDVPALKKAVTSLLKLTEADSGQPLVGYYRLEHARINFRHVPRQASTAN